MKLSEKSNTDKKTPLSDDQKSLRDTSDVVNIPDGLKKAFDNPDRPEPTRYGDWEKNGRCIDF